MSYELKQEDISGFVSFIGAETKHKGDELQFKLCPYCNGGRNKDQYTFSMNERTGLFNCARGTCGRKGHFIQLCRDFDFHLDLDNERKYTEFPQPEKRIVPIESAYAYLESRCISRKTAERYQVTAFKDRPNVMWFPFFDEDKRLVFAKFRRMDFKKGVSKGSKEWQQAGGKPILFGMTECEDFDTLVITEGQLDSMSVAEAGIKNAVSVPSGKNNFQWIANCMNWIRKFTTVVVFGDLENGKMSLLDEITKKFPNRIRAVRKQDYLGEKDANAILQKFGAEAVRDCVNNAVSLNAECVKSLAEVSSPNLNELQRIETGIYELDEALNGGIVLGQVCLLSGKRGDGKSTLMSQMAADAIQQGYGVFIYSAELPDYHFKAWMNTQVAGEENLVGKQNKYGTMNYYVRDDVQKKIDKWYSGKAFIFDNAYTDEHPDEELKLIDVIEQTIKQNGVQLICVDNLMTAMESVRSQNELYMAQGKFVGQLKKLAIKYKVAVILIAHPRKTGKDDDHDFDSDDVAGSADITNKVDIVLNYSRPKREQAYQRQLTLEKNRLYGILLKGENAIPMYYNAKTRQITGARTLPKRYGWQDDPVRVDDIDVPF